jgi:hypothetical protein
MIEENEEIAQQRAEVERHTRELDEALEKLKQATKRPLGLADRIREEPLLWLGGAVVVGLILGSRNHGTGVIYES